MSWTLGWFESLQQSSRHDIEVKSPVSGAFCTSLQVPRNGTGTCKLTQEQANEFEEGKLRVRIISRKDIGGGLIPADHHIYSDSFDFGDTGSWSETAP